MKRKIKIDLSNENSKFPKELADVVNKAVKLIDAIKNLRGKYIAEDDLPLLPFKSDYENMIIIAKAIGQEAMKFGLPGSTEFCFFGEEELQKISNDDEAMRAHGLDEWVEEGLFDREFYVKKFDKDSNTSY